MEDFFLDDKSQLEKRIAIGDSSFLDKMTKKDAKIMKKVIKDIQTQLLTHNGFVKCVRSYRKDLEEKIQTQLTQAENEFDANVMIQLKSQLHDDDDEEMEDNASDDDHDTEDDEDACDVDNPFSKVIVNSRQRKYFRREMQKKDAFLTEQRELIRENLVHNIELRIEQPHKKPTTIQQRTYNDPREHVVCQFIPNDQPNRPRVAVYQCVRKDGDNKTKAIDERSVEYDLMAYPLFFPEGTDIKLGWTVSVPKVMEKDVLINSEYDRVKDQIATDLQASVRTLSDKVKVIKKVRGLKKLKVKDFEYQQLIDLGEQTVSAQQWYNFMFFERAGFLKDSVFTPEMELHEYNYACNAKLNQNHKHRQVKIKSDAEVYNKTVKIGNKRVKLKVHPVSRIPYFTNDDGEDVGIDANHTKIPSELRTPIKKSPILYQIISMRIQSLTLIELRRTSETILLL